MNPNLRVCRRSKENIILLWDLKAIGQNDRLKIFLDGKPLIIHAARSLREINQEEPALTLPESTGVCLINHAENNLSSSEEYTLEVEFGTELDPISIRILPYGVLPEVEKDDKTKHVQLMAWDKTKKKWRKVEGIETKNGFALLISSGGDE